jgi:hypothetical protein
VIKYDKDNYPWYEKDGKWLPCTAVELEDGRIEYLQATKEEILSSVYLI